MKLESCHLREATEFVLPPPPVEPIAATGSGVPIPNNRDEAALALYGRPYEELKPAHRAWVTMRIRRGEYD